MRPILAHAALVAAVGLTGCLPPPASFRPGPDLGAVLAVRPELARRVLSVVPPYAPADVVRLHLELHTVTAGSEDAAPLQQVDVPAGSLGNVITFAHLRYQTGYRVRAMAFDAGNNEISTPPGGLAVDLTTEGNIDDAPPPVSLTIQLKNKPFAASGATTIDLSEGGYRPYGWVSTLGGPLPAGAAPTDVAIDSTGNIFVSDAARHCIYQLDPTGSPLATYGTPGASGTPDVGAPASVHFNAPEGLALRETRDGTVKILYVADTGNNAIRAIDLLANDVSTALGAADGSAGYQNGSLAVARFKSPADLWVSEEGQMIVADTGNHAIRFADPDKPATDPAYVLTLAGADDTASPQAGYVDAGGTSARFDTPVALAVDENHLYVADAGNHAIRRIDLPPEETFATPAVTTLAGGAVGAADGQGTGAFFNTPAGLVVDESGDVYVADRLNHAIRRITPDGRVSTLAGALGVAGAADGARGSASFTEPLGLGLWNDYNTRRESLVVVQRQNTQIRKVQ